MSGLFSQRTEFIKPSLRRVDFKHPMAQGMRLCYLPTGWDIREIVRGDAPTYDPLRGTAPYSYNTHAELGQQFDRNAATFAPRMGRPLGQGRIATREGAGTTFSDRITFPATELYKFLDYDKPWSFWWQGRPQVTGSPGYGALFAWGVVGAVYRGFDLFYGVTGHLNVHMINYWSTNAKKLQLDYIPQSFEPVSVGVSYTGIPSGLGGYTEFKALTVNGKAVDRVLVDGATDLNASFQPAAGVDLSLFSRQTDSMGHGDMTTLVFWDRALSEGEFRDLHMYGLPLV